MQLSLLDQIDSGPDAGFATVRRMQLSRDCWIEHTPDWLGGHGRLFELLAQTADWEQHRRTMYDRIVDVPRLVAGAPGGSWGFDTDAEVQRLPSAASGEQVRLAAHQLAEMAALLSARYRRVVDSVTLAYYRDGRDSVAYHGDKMKELRSDTVVAIVSVGAPRRFLIKPAEKQNRMQKSISLQFCGGDLIVMGGACQRDFLHAVPKMARAGPRIAIMFRERLPELRRAGAFQESDRKVTSL